MTQKLHFSTAALTLAILGLAIAPVALAQTAAVPDRFKQLDKNGDGKLTRNEVADAAAFTAADRDKDGTVTVEEYRRYVASRPKPPAPNAQSAVPASPAPPPVNGVPVLKQLPDCDAVRDAAGTGQLFECVHVPGITDHRAGMNGFAIVDLNRDGRPDVVATTTPMDAVPGKPFRDTLRVLINEGGFRFREHHIEIRGSDLSHEVFGQWSQIPNFADLNQDGFLDLLVTRSSQNRNRQGTGGNTLLLSDGAWDRFVDASATMGLRNETAYNRQTSFGDVNGDGWLDLAIGCDNIKNANGGVPHSRLYVFRPNGPKFEDGQFEDIGGSELVPDFGGFYRDSAKDKAGPDVNLRDLDNDGDLDLIQSFHVDVRDPLAPNSPGEYRQGVMCWKNLLRETGELRFEKITGNGLHCEARLTYNREKQLYEPTSEARAPGLPYLSFADVDGDGLQDILGVGPDSDYWAPRVEHVTGRYWKNLSSFRFEDRTASTGFAPLNNTYGQWMDFFDEQRPARWANWKPAARFESQPGLTPQHPSKNTPYFADAIFADLDNDGALDVVVLNRSESLNPRSFLLMGKGDGTFEIKPTTFSGLDSSGISGEAADLNGDGLLDLVFAADPANSAGSAPVAPERFESKVYWNSGERGAKQNHWLHLTFTGLTDAELIGARVELIADGRKQYRWIHSNHTYKSGGALDSHFGLGKATTAEITVTLLDGHSKNFPRLAVDMTHKLTLDIP
ncbi:MAG: CRTAC1 family protein [Planctomycetaceae bacterium]|nr:CRTAC1 family protein [Planctomycetales bacterium]MCB9925843.1 CRTAC1 family protein [Planctomycetaceae bacterium]